MCVIKRKFLKYFFSIPKTHYNIQKIFNADDITKENSKDHKKWQYIPDHPYRMSIIEGSGSGKTDALLNLVKEQDDIDKTYLYTEDLSEPKYGFLIKKREDVGIKHLNCSSVFMEFSQILDDIYEDINECNPIRKSLTVFDDMIADIISNKTYQAIIKEVFIRCRKLNVSLLFITKSYFSVPKDVS